MDTKDISIDELYYLSLEENEDAKLLLFKKFLLIINTNIKKYKQIAKQLNVCHEELFSEALYGVTDALNTYKIVENATLGTFINCCIERKITNIFRNRRATKRKLLIDIYSYNDDIIVDNNDPLKKIICKDYYTKLSNYLINSLSSLEYNVYKYLLKGYKCKEISKILNKEPKQIDNAIQRIKQKVKKMQEKSCI